MADPAVIVEKDGPILIVTLNRPEKKNAVNSEVMCRLYDAWVQLDEDDELRVAILTGRGDTFCAGMDLGEIGKMRTGAADNPWISVHYAPHTFEVDFVAAGNHRPVVAALPDYYTSPATIALATSELQSGDIAQFGRRVLTIAAGAGKGWFAIQVAKKIDADTELPDYIAQALFTAHSPSRPVVANILLHRIKHLEASGLENPETIESMRVHVERFREGEIALAELLVEMVAAFPADQISRILNHTA